MLILGMALFTLIDALIVSPLVNSISIMALVTCIILFIFQSKKDTRDANEAGKIIGISNSVSASLIAKLMINTSNNIEDDGNFAKENQETIDKYSSDYRDAIELTNKMIKEAKKKGVIKPQQINAIRLAVSNDCDDLKGRAFKKIKDEE